jgi:signal peptide peptidase SppA
MPPQAGNDQIVLQAVIGDPSGIAAPHYEQYFGAWAMNEEVFLRAFNRISSLDLRSHAARQRSDASPRDAAAPAAVGEAVAEDVSRPNNYAFPVTSSGVAVLSISGVMMKHVGSLEDGTSTVRVRRHLRAAARDPQISGVMIVVDSPGGSVAGTRDLAEDIAAVARIKPVHVYVDGMCCSAAMWASSQASVISAGPDAIVGSIGTYMPVYDFSGWAKQEGIAVYLVKEGEFKGAGTPGTEITDEQLAEWKRTITSLNAQFVGQIATGLRISSKRAKELNDGRVHVGEEAKAMGLVTYVENIDAAMNRMEDAAAKWRKKNPSGAGASGAAGLAAAVADDTDPEDPEMPDPEKLDDEEDDDEDNTDGDAAGSTPDEVTAMNEQTKGNAAATTPTPTASKPAGAVPAPAATEPKPASITDLKAAFADDPAYALEAAEKALTLTEAKAGYADVLSARLKEANSKLAVATAAGAATAAGGKAAETTTPAAAAEQPKRPGVKAVESAGAAERAAVDGGADVIQMRDKLTENGRMTRAQAMSKISREHPEMMKEFIESASAAKR